MSAWLTLETALEALRRNVMRTALTALGIIIGVAAVIVMMALGNGARAAIEARIRTAGTEPHHRHAGVGQRGGRSHRTGRPHHADAGRFGRHRATGDGHRGHVARSVHARAGRLGDGQLVHADPGASAELQAIRDWDTESGAFFTDADVARAAKVAVLGSVVRDQLFGAGVDPTGQTIRISNQPFAVVGVLTSKGQSAIGQDQDDTVVVPYTTVQKKLTGNTYLSNLTIEAASEDQIQTVAGAVSTLLRERHRLQPGEADDFTVRTLEEMTSVLTSTTSTMTWLLASVAAVSLIVGGIGVMNIMLVSVTERTREIGLRMSLGARKRDVLRQFLAESLALSLAGGLAGILLGIGAVVRRQPVAVVECERVARVGDGVIRVRGGDRRVLWSLSCPPRRRAAARSKRCGMNEPLRYESCSMSCDITVVRYDSVGR